MTSIPVGVQMFTLRDESEKDFAATLIATGISSKEGRTIDPSKFFNQR